METKLVIEKYGKGKEQFKRINQRIEDTKRIFSMKIDNKFNQAGGC